LFTGFLRVIVALRNLPLLTIPVADPGKASAATTRKRLSASIY
jgi:hypothetical protein